MVIAIVIVRQSIKVSFATSIQTEIIKATAAIFTAFNFERILFDFFHFWY